MSDRPTYDELHRKVLQLERQLEQRNEAEKLLHQDRSAEHELCLLMKRMLDNVPDMIWAKDLEDRYLFANRGICKNLLKCDSGKEVAGKSDIYFALRERAAGHEHTFGEICVDSDQVVKDTATPGRFLEHGLVRGKNLVLDVHKAPFFNKSGELIGTVGCGRDVTKEKEVEKALENASNVLRNIVADIDGVSVQGYNREREVTVWNQASERLYGYTAEEALGRKLEDLIIPDGMRKEVIQAIERWHQQGEKIPSGELVLRDKDEKEVHVYSCHTMQETSKGKEMFCIDIDLSDIRKAEKEKNALAQQLEMAQKMEAIGTLAGGIAHDFNNILSAITGYAELAESELPENSRAKKDIDMILKASQRATELVKQILTFSRKKPQDRKPIRMKHIINEAMHMMRSSLPSTISISTNYRAKRDTVLADPTGIHQVVVNLCTNALHAMKEQKGDLKVTLDTKQIDTHTVKGEWDIKKGEYVVLSVEDSGHGMDEQTRQQIFEPYFTTKERGEGTGLGLAMVHGIVTRCGGFIETESEIGSGTSFHVFLPLIERSERTSSPDEAIKALPTGKEHILFIDDEVALCNISKTILTSLGYRVTVENDSIKAFNSFKQDPDAFDLIISDQTMPHLTGTEFAAAVLQLRPDIPFILCTGYSAAITRQDALKMGISRFIEKPFSKGDLATCVRNVLDGKEPDTEA